MELLERYLQEVGRYLAAEAREDTLAELRANLLAEMDARVEELGRPLTEAEIAAILKAHGRPMLVASRYMPQRYLIGPTAFPLYLFVLRKALPFVMLIYFFVRVPVLIFAEGERSFIGGMVAATIQLVPVLLIFWATVTIIFASIDYAQQQGGKGADMDTWDPEKLPPLTRATAKKERPLSSRIADLVVHCVWMLYVFAIPSHPFLILGPGAFFLTVISVGFAPIWRAFYIAFVVLLVAQLGLKVMTFSREAERWKGPVELVTKVAGVLMTGWLAFTKVYFIPTGPGADLHTLATVNYWMNVS